MWDIVRGVATGTLFKTRKVNTDSTIFKLHYRATFCIILLFTAILAANQYVGKPIRCMHHMDEHPDEILDTFCWIHSTYTVTKAFYKKVGVDVPFPGVDNSRGNQEEVKVYRFYQWVSFCLLFQVRLKVPTSTSLNRLTKSWRMKFTRQAECIGQMRNGNQF